MKKLPVCIRPFLKPSTKQNQTDAKIGHHSTYQQIPYPIPGSTSKDIRLRSGTANYSKAGSSASLVQREGVS